MSINNCQAIQKRCIDRRARTHQNALKVVQDAMEDLELSDIWRILNPRIAKGLPGDRDRHLKFNVDLTSSW